MWEQFTAVSVWVLIGAGVLLVISLVFRENIREKLSHILRKKGGGRSDKAVSVTFWIIEVVLLVVVVLSLVAMTGSQEGAGAILTPQAIQRWFLEHGVAILVIVVVAAVLWAVAQRFIPVPIGRGLVKTKGEGREEMQRRRTTLNAVIKGLARVVIIIGAIMSILDELSIPIGPVLAGFGIVGIAVGFGAQYLIRDLDGVVHHVPNGEIRVASNYTRYFSRVNLDVSVSYGTDLEYAISVINRVCKEMAEEEAWAPLIKSVPQVLRVNKPSHLEVGK